MRVQLDDVDADGVRLGVLALLPKLNVTLVYIPGEQPLLLAAPGLSETGQPRLHFRPTSDAGDAFYTVPKAALGPAVRKLQSTTRRRVLHDGNTVELVSVASLWSVLRHTPRVKVEVPAEPHPPASFDALLRSRCLPAMRSGETHLYWLQGPLKDDFEVGGR